MNLKLLGAFAVSALLLFSGCATTDASVAPVKKELATPTKKVAALIEKYDLEVVDFAYAKEAVGEGTRKGAKALLIDSRPAKMYQKSTITTSLNIPDTKFNDYIGQLDNIAKDKRILVYCGGWHCTKSPKVAGMLQRRGFTNVKLYQAGLPEWKRETYYEVGTAVVVAAYKKNSAVIIDTRPHKKYLGATIPGAISIAETKLAELEGRFPADKSTPIITFCTGHICHKAHVVAQRLVDLGYTNVKVYGGGFPAWKKAGMPTTGSKAKRVSQEEAKKPAKMVAGILLGEDEGTVDGEWLKARLDNLPANVQIVDVRSADEFQVGHIAGAINIEAGKMKAKEFVSKLPKGKTVIFNCSAGARSMEAWDKAKEGGADMTKAYYFDANIACEGNKCSIEVNEPLG